MLVSMDANVHPSFVNSHLWQWVCKSQKEFRLF